MRAGGGRERENISKSNGIVRRMYACVYTNKNEAIHNENRMQTEQAGKRAKYHRLEQHFFFAQQFVVSFYFVCFFRLEEFLKQTHSSCLEVC